jgi:hypothetical protein
LTAFGVAPPPGPVAFVPGVTAGGAALNGVAFVGPASVPPAPPRVAGAICSGRAAGPEVCALAGGMDGTGAGVKPAPTSDETEGGLAAVEEGDEVGCAKAGAAQSSSAATVR